jgi:hypothetical protein
MREIDSADHGAAVRVDQMKGAGAGTTGAQEGDVWFPDLGDDVRFKLKPVKRSLDGINNSPRKEVAAFAIQSFFLEPEDYVVPTTTIYCIPLEHLDHAKIRHGGATLKGTKCELVGVALWLNDLTLRDPVYDEARFLRDPAYAYYLSNLNVFT